MSSSNTFSEAAIVFNLGLGVSVNNSGPPALPASLIGCLSCGRHGPKGFAYFLLFNHSSHPVPKGYCYSQGSAEVGDRK